MCFEILLAHLFSLHWTWGMLFTTFCVCLFLLTFPLLLLFFYSYKYLFLSFQNKKIKRNQTNTKTLTVHMLGVIGEESGIEALFGNSNARVDPSTNKIQWEQWDGCSQVQFCGVPLDSSSQYIPPLKTDDNNLTAIVLVFDNRGKSNTFLNKHGTSLQLFKWAQDYFDRRGTTNSFFFCY